MPDPEKAAAPPPPPEVNDRKARLIFVRNVTKAPLCEHPGGDRTVIHPGRIGQIDEERLEALGPAVTSAGKADFERQERDDAAKRKAGTA